jgi:hypothetical protein
MYGQPSKIAEAKEPASMARSVLAAAHRFVQTA